jgi:hypothetical protein
MRGYPPGLALGAEEDLGRPAPGQGHLGPCLFGVAVAGEEFESLN